MKKLKTLYGLPQKIIFCKKTLMSNQRPSSEQEFTHSIKSKKKTIFFDKNGICDAWKYSRKKKTNRLSTTRKRTFESFREAQRKAW